MQIGEKLREAREEKQLSLEDIQKITKIQSRYLVAIEQDDFYALPGKFYARAFIKEYAQAVGIDPVDLLYGFDEEKIQTKEDEKVQYTRMDRARRPKEAKGSSVLSFLPTVIVVILVIGIIFVAWTLSQKTVLNPEGDVENPSDDEIVRDADREKSGDSVNNNETNSDDSETTDDAEQKDEEEEVTEGEFSVVETGSGNSPLSTLDFTYSGDTAEVTFEIESTSYVAVQKEDETYVQEGNLEPDQSIDPIDVSDEDKIYFNIGNASGVKVFINDVELEYPVAPDEAVHQKMWVNLNKAE